MKNRRNNAMGYDAMAVPSTIETPNAIGRWWVTLGLGLLLWSSAASPGLAQCYVEEAQKLLGGGSTFGSAVDIDGDAAVVGDHAYLMLFKDTIPPGR